MPLEDLLKKSNPDNYDSSVAEHIPRYPGLSLTGHVITKNIQLGSVVGSVVGTGWWLARPKTQSLIKVAWPRAALVGAGFGILTGAGMMAFKMKTIDLEGLEDRTYRIHENKKVFALNFCTVAGAMVVPLAGVFMRSAPGAKRLFPLGYVAQGMSIGFLGFVAAQASGLDPGEALAKYDK